jgi:hypothetical protein
MSITPKAIRDLLDELEASKQSRLRAWNVSQRLRSVLSENGSVASPSPAQKTFDADGEALKHALRKSFRIRRCKFQPFQQDISFADLIAGAEKRFACFAARKKRRDYKIASHRV